MSLPHSLFLVIFGASGDLTRRKLMPALIKIHNGKRFPEHFAIIGCARTAYTDETYRAYLKEDYNEQRCFHYMAYMAIIAYYWFVWAMYRESCGAIMGESLYQWYEMAKKYADHLL